jgi:hypothetical protein
MGGQSTDFNFTLGMQAELATVIIITISGFVSNPE